MVAYALIAAVLTLWSRPPRAALHAICPAGTIAATAAVAFAEPIGLTPIFYLWPMLVAAYFLGRAEVGRQPGAASRHRAGTALGAVDGARPADRHLHRRPGDRGRRDGRRRWCLREQVLALVLRLRTLASHDSLTGALNRGAFEQRMDAELARARRSATALSLVVFDVDHFKRLDDSYGHAAATPRCAASATSSRSGMRRSDVFGRLGGEEFGLLLPDTDIAGAATVADKLRRRLSAPAAVAAR